MRGKRFEEWFSTFRKSINGYDYYTDFAKVYENARRYKIEANILGSLIGSRSIEADFEEIIKQYPECLKVIPTLLAVRAREIHCRDETGATDFRFDKPTQSIEEYKVFMRKTGLFDMLQYGIVCNLYDYVTGVEVGLDSNARKNRGGRQMETLVAKFLDKAGVRYHPQVPLSEVEREYGVDLSAISAGGTSEKVWDFVVKTPSRLYVMETNFYATGGSKLNETARSYKMIAEEAKTIPSFRFIWITDGGGWKSAKRNLEEAYNALDDLYNIADMEGDLFAALFK